MDAFVPPRPLRNSRGEVRRVGIELEFAGMPLEEAAAAVRAAFNGHVRRDHEHRFTVATDLGDFEVTYDTPILSSPAAPAPRASFLKKGWRGAVGWLVRRFGGTVLPLEIGTPPIPADRLGALGVLERELRARGAEGTRAGAFNAFALHFNAEAADPGDPACVVGALRAFLLLHRWLVRAERVDRLRRLMPFINPFPEPFAQLVLDPGYRPDLKTFAADYVAHSPTRNRPLDLLPLLAFGDPGFLTRPELAGQKVRPRPAFHYRLPNSGIDEPGWSIAEVWNRWVLVERLAADPALCARFAREYLTWQGSALGYLSDRWVRHVAEKWVPLLSGGARPLARPNKRPVAQPAG